MATAADVWSNSSDSESDEEEVAETVGMETGRLSSLDSLELVLKAIQNVKEEQMVKTSCRGKVVVDLLSMLPQNGKNITDLCASLVKELETCFHDSSKFMGGQTSIVVGKLWSSYHKARFSKKIRAVWESLISTVPMSSELAGESELALQLVIDRTMKLLINEVSKSALPSAATHAVAALSEREKNGIRYMAGYVVLKLVKKFTRTCTSEKHKAFVRILNSLKARDQDVPVLEDYTTAWVEQVNRGGLCLIKKEVIE